MDCSEINHFNQPLCLVVFLLKTQSEKLSFSQFFNDKYQVFKAFVNQMFTNIN